jgi:hypothetical protein
MAIRVNYSSDPTIARLQRKRDQAHEMMCLALNDRDKEAAEKYRKQAEEYRQLILELRSSQ